MVTELAGAVGEKTRSTRAAARMQRSRKRRRNGLRCYSIELRDNEVEALVDLGDLGLLSPAECANRPSIIKALHRFFDETLGKLRSAQPGSR